MYKRSTFHLDCHPIIPQCSFQCPRCIQEIQATISRVKGVTSVYLDEGPKGSQIIVEHDSTLVTAEELLEAFKKLPTFYDARFIPTLSAQA